MLWTTVADTYEIEALLGGAPVGGGLAYALRVLPGGPSRRREFCHLTSIPSPVPLKRLPKAEGGAAE